MATTRRATATWRGDLLAGSGTVTAATTGIFRDQATTWEARTEEADGVTSPGGAARRGPRLLLLDGLLEHPGQGRHAAGPPRRGGQCHGRQARGRLDGPVRRDRRSRPRPGRDPGELRRGRGEAKDGCPISRALKGNVEMTVEATLEGW